MNKLSFRARALDATKSLPVYRDNEIPDNADCSLINRAVPQMPTGMEKEEESEHHLQRAICAGTVIPTPEVFDLEDLAYYGMLYPEDYKMPRQLIYMQPFSMEADIPDYDMDSEDESWVDLQTIKLELTPTKFEEMMDRLEKGSGQTVVTLQEAKALIKEDDDLIIAVYDYWLNKRLKTQHPLIPQVRTEARFGVSNHNPYIAFRRRTEKMQTRKNRKNDESSYEKMLKLKRDLSRAVTLLEMVKRREKSKRELLHLSIEVFEKRYQAGDFSGQLVAEAFAALAQRPTRPAFTPLFQPNHVGWAKDDPLLASGSRKEKRHYKKRRHKTKNQHPCTPSTSVLLNSAQGLGFPQDDDYLSSEDDVPVQVSPSDAEEEEDDGTYSFKRKLNCDYHAPAEFYPWSWCSKNEENGEKRSRLSPPSLEPTTTHSAESTPHPADPTPHPSDPIGRPRRRIGRGGRLMLDRKDHQALKKAISSSTSTTPTTTLEGFDTSTDTFGVNSGSWRPDNFFRPIRPSRGELFHSEVRLENIEVKEQVKEERDKLLPKVELGTFLGAVVAKGERPLVFDMEELLSDTSLQRHSRPTNVNLFMDDGGIDETELLDEFEANLRNSHYLEETNEFDMRYDSWISGDTRSSPFLPSSPISIDVIDLCSSEPLDTSAAAGTGAMEYFTDKPKVEVGDCPPDTLQSEVKQEPSGTEGLSSSSPIAEGQGSGFEGNNSFSSSDIKMETDSASPQGFVERKRSLDKDDKENEMNDRITIVAHPRDRVVVSDEEHNIVENGDVSADSSEECMIVEEQKPNFLLAPKSWKVESPFSG